MKGFILVGFNKKIILSSGYSPGVPFGRGSVVLRRGSGELPRESFSVVNVVRSEPGQ